jgi:hypothetical protein
MNTTCTCEGCLDPLRRVDRELAGHHDRVRAAIEARDAAATGRALDAIHTWVAPILAGTELDRETRRELAGVVWRLAVRGEVGQ